MRKETVVTIIDDGEERQFRIRQMSAIKAERWLNRAGLLLAGAVPQGDGSMRGLEQKLKAASATIEDLLALLGRLEYDKLEPLYDELLECCEHIPEKNNLNFSKPLTRENADSVIGDVKTLYMLRLESAKLNFGFFFNVVNSQPQKAPKEPGIKFTKNTRTSAAK